MGLLFVAIHAVVAIFAIAKHRKNKPEFQLMKLVGDVLGLLSLPVVIVTTWFLLLPNSGGSGSGAAWFMIFAVVTLGGAVVLTLASFWFFGRGVGRILGWFEHSKTGPVAANAV
ncbi:MAG: hypothetical protein AAF468_21625 [Pseudomonadota bacterium]